MGSSTPQSASPRVEELILSGADVNVLNHTTLSLWHFRQLVLELVPSAASSLETEEDQGVKGPEMAVVSSPSCGIDLGEGMSVAAVLYEQDINAQNSEISSGDAEPTGDNSNKTEGSTLQLQGVTTRILGRLTPNTRVAAVFKRYRCVLCLDASPSILSIDPSSGRLFLDLLYESVELFIWSILRPMEVGGKGFAPEIHVSVLVQGALVESLCVLMQGYIVTPSNAAGFLQLIKERFQLIENDWASQAQERGQWGYLGNATPASLDWILQNVVFALNSLPTDCTPMMVLVTDGVLDVRDVYSYDNLLMQLVRHDIQCHFLRIGGGDEDELIATFGFVPDMHLLRFVAEYTGGTVFDYAAIYEACYGSTSISSNIVKKMTDLQDACFLRKSSVHANSAPVVKLNEMDSTSFDKRTLLPLRPYRMWRDKVHEYRIFSDVNRVVEARCREGFSINKVHIKAYQQPSLVDKGTGDISSAAPNNELIQILIVFIFKWKENVWLEYVVSSTTDSSATLAVSASTMPNSSRRSSSHGTKGIGSNSSTKISAATFTKDQRTAWSEWHVKMNILAYADFLRAFEDTNQRSSGEDGGSPARDFMGVALLSSPMCVQDFIRNVQDVDRVLLHLMTATASINEISDSYANQFSFGTSVSASAVSASSTSKITSSHPVFNIIGELSSVLWHRWFFVERFEILCIVKSDVCTTLFYKNEIHKTVERGIAGSHLRNPKNVTYRTIHSQSANVHEKSSVHSPIGIESLSELLVAILVEWSSQKLSRDLFLRFLPSSFPDKGGYTLRNKLSPSPAAASGGVVQRRRQRSQTINSTEDTTYGDNSMNANENNGALCFVRLEFKTKALCAVNVAFFATKASTRRNVINDLKSTIFAGINEASGTLSPAKLLPPLPIETSVILCHRMLSRLLVTHDTLLLHGLDQEPGPFDYDAVSPSLEAEKNAGAISPSTVCCGGSKLQLQRVFGAYVWHSSWKWEVANLRTLFDVMRRLHNARISCGFWVLDWKMDEGDGGQSYAESVIFGREVLMEDEKGHTKTALVQYALRRVSDTCLMTSIWMEPQHGTVKTRLSNEVDHSDRFHWSLKQAIGHSIPFEKYENCSAQQDGTPRASSRRPVSSPSLDIGEQKSMEQGEMSSDRGKDSTYLGESELLHLIRGYLLKTDCHFLSCLYTFDCIINLRENMEMSSELSKNAGSVVGSNWIVDRQMAAENGMILPPFSTARLLSTSKRSTQHFLMYLQCGKTCSNAKNEVTVGALPTVSTANENLYSMLELTLRGLSDCEVAWTDYNGDVVTDSSIYTSNLKEDDRVFLEGMDGQLPLWIKHHTALSFQERAPNHAFSKGKCFAKLVSDDCVVLAFFPSLDTLHIKTKGVSIGDSDSKLPSKVTDKNGDLKRPSQARAAGEDKLDTHLMRISVSADDMVLYQERRRNFREGYKSWRMGHFQGSRDEKQSYGRDFQKLRLPSTPEDHEICDEVSRSTPYGCDSHLLIKSSSGVLGSGFFQVAFYECSLSRLTTNMHNDSSEMLEDLPHTILKHLFFTKQRKVEQPSVQHNRRGNLKMTFGRSSLELKEGLHSQMSPEDLLASRRFRKKVKRAHEHNFSRGVYMALRDGGAVQHSDLLQALSSCIEIPMDIDITLLYRMMETATSYDLSPLSSATAAVVSAGAGSEILKDKLIKSFEKVLSSVFISIPGTRYYYYTGTENSSFEDLAGIEYGLHVLMEESNDADSNAYVERLRREGSNSIVSSDGDLLSYSIARDDVSCLNAGAEGDADNKRRRRSSLGSVASVPVITLAEESSENGQYDANVDEDAEFNKEVAVATSSFSVPFFLRFECRILNNLREIGSNSANARAHEAISDPQLLRRSSGTAAYDDLRKAVAANEHLSSPSSRRKDFNDFLESLRNVKGSCKPFKSVDVTQIAEAFSKVPTGRIALRLVTLTLPNERALNAGCVTPFDMDNSRLDGKESALPSVRSHSFSTLHSFQRQVLSQVRNDIKEWCSVEILAILKSADEITPAIGELVQRLFDNLPEHAITKATYPLEFVGHSQEAPVNSADLFKRELEEGDLLNVQHCNGVYFVVKKSNIGDKGGYHSDTKIEIPYWAFFEVESDHISLQYHHPDRFKPSSAKLNRLEVLTRLQIGVRAVCRRVNQFLLLLQLHETRTCNGLLLPADGNLPSSPRSPKRRARSQENLCEIYKRTKQASFFWPGQFECDLRYSAFFRLHERLAPNFALNLLCTSALEQFQVHNRRHMFVYRDRDGHVFYMKISISYDTTLPLVFGIQPAEERQERVSIARPKAGGTNSGGPTNSTPATTPSGVSCIRLEVFGISEAGEEVTHELCRLLERKLDEGTQVVLMKLLARNTKFQLSQTDLAFLCPPKAEPSCVIDYVLSPEVANWCKLLHYLSQTLKLTPYIRPVTSCGSSRSGNPRDVVSLGGRRGSLVFADSHFGLIGEEDPKTFSHNSRAYDFFDDGEKAFGVQASTRIHPACFGIYQKALAELPDDCSIPVNATTCSPVFFSSKLEEKMKSIVEDSATAFPEIAAQAFYVLNLNPDLRLSQGFLTRVGKGLALMRVDLIQSNFAKQVSNEEYRVKRMHDIPGLKGLYPNERRIENAVATTQIVARCQMWNRGSIHTKELSQVMETFLDEALYDFHIESVIEKLKSRADSNAEAPCVSESKGKMPPDVDTLVSLLKSACRLPSSSVTRLGMNLHIPPWDLENIMVQSQTFLNRLPSHLRPVVYAKSRLSGTYECVSGRNRDINANLLINGSLPHKFRLLVKHADIPDDADSSDSDAETIASVSSALHHIEPLVRADSIRSENSEIDSVSGRVWTVPASSDTNAVSQMPTTPSVSSTTSSITGVMGGLGNQPHLSNKMTFSERDVLLYPSSKSSSYRHHQVLASTQQGELKRSLYYVVDFSTTKGLRFYGYNMGSGLVEALATHLAHVLTWSSLREKLLQSLLLEKVGISTAAPVGSVVLQPRTLFMTVKKLEQVGKGVGQNPVTFCKDCTVNFIEYQAPVLSILQLNEYFPEKLDSSRLRTIDGTALEVYLREAQTQPVLESSDALYARPRGKSNTNLSGSIGPPSISDVSRELSGPPLSQQTPHNDRNAPSNVLEAHLSGNTRSSGIVSSSNVSSSMSSSPNRRSSRSSSALPHLSENRSESTARMRGGAGAATALMAARARARGGSGLSNRMGSGLGVSAGYRDRRDSTAPTVVSLDDNIAPWDLPLFNTKGPQLRTLANEAESLTDARHDSNSLTGSHVQNDVESAKGVKSGLKSTQSEASHPVGKISRGSSLSVKGLSSSSSSLSELGISTASAHRRLMNDTSMAQRSRNYSSWKNRLECAWRPRFFYFDYNKRWEMGSTNSHHLKKLEEDEDRLKKNINPLSFYCAALEKRWEAFETRSTSHTVEMNLLQKLASLRVDEEMKEPVANDIVEHLLESGHILLHQRFRAAFVERWVAAEVTESISDSDEVGVLRALQSCMDLVHLLSYKREFVFDREGCAVAKLYTEHTVHSMDAGAGADVRATKEQVAANLKSLRLEITSEFCEEYAMHLRTLGFRRLRTLRLGSHVRAFSVDPNAAATENESLGAEEFSEYYYHSERAAAEVGSWKSGANHTNLNSASIVVLEVKCDNRGVLLNAVIVSLSDLVQQDLHAHHRFLAAKAENNIIEASGPKLQRVTSWLRAQLQTQALIYGFTIRYFQQHLLQWLSALHENHEQDNTRDRSAGKLLGEDDALVVTPSMARKKASTFQNIVKGLQCFLQAFPHPPEPTNGPQTSLSTTVSSCDGITASKNKDNLKASRASTARINANDRLASRKVARYAWQGTTKQSQQQSSNHSALFKLDSRAKPTVPLSKLWRDCVIRVITVTLPPTLLQSNCSDLIMVQILLRYVACHGSRYKVLDLLQFGTPDTVACHSSSGSFFYGPPHTITPSRHGRVDDFFNGYSLMITTQPLAHKSHDKNSVQLLLLKSASSESGAGNGVLSVERALEEAQLFTRELFCVAAQHYERDLLWSRLLYDNSRGPGCDVAYKLALPTDLFRVEVGPQQLEECLRLSICTPLEALDPRLDELLRVSGVCWQELALRLRDIYADQLREFQFQEEDEESSHLLLLCPDAFDLIIHLTFITPKDPIVAPKQGGHGVASASEDESINNPSQSDGSLISCSNEVFCRGDMRMEICRREEPSNKQFTFAQRRSISEFVNSIVHWQWRSLIYD